MPSGLLARIAGPLATAQTRFSGERAEFFRARMASHGLNSVGDYLAELPKFNMLDHAGAITCPTLIVECETDFAGGGGETLVDALTCPRQIVHLTTAQGADGHCAGLGQQVWNRAVYGWLETVLHSSSSSAS